MRAEFVRECFVENPYYYIKNEKEFQEETKLVEKKKTIDLLN